MRFNPVSRRSLLRAAALVLVMVSTGSTARAADPAAFARIVARQYHVDARHVVTADIDRDGDLDVLAATDGGFMVWVNDGHGRFTSQAPSHRPLIDGTRSPDSWSDEESRETETIQTTISSIPLGGEYAHAPPDASSGPPAPAEVPPPTDASRRCRTPRAPPALIEP